MKANLWIDEGRIFVSFHVHAAYIDAARALPGGRFNPGKLHWSCPGTPWVARTAVFLFLQANKIAGGTLDITTGVYDLAAKAEKASECARRFDEVPIKRHPNSVLVPWRHQFVATSCALELPSLYLDYDMGVGKTKAILDLLLYLLDLRGRVFALISCPNSVIDVWPREVLKHVRDPSAFSISALRGKPLAKRVKDAASALTHAGAHNKIGLVVANYEAFALDKSPMLSFCAATDWDVVVPDEAHRLASPGSKTTLAFVNKIAPRARKRVCLSGTPLRNSCLDIFSQCKFLDPGVFGSSNAAFLDRYAVLDHWGAVVGTKNEAELAERFSWLALHVDKRDVLDLPPVTISDRRFDLSPEAVRHYEEFEEKLALEFEQGTAVAANALVKLLRLTQMTSGYLPIVNEETKVERVQRIDGGKAAELAEIFDEVSSNEPIVVFCRFRHDIDEVETMAETAGRGFYELSGKDNRLRDWQDAKGGEVLAVQIQAGGIGVDLTRSAYGVFYSIGFGLSEYEQAKARLDRPGQTRPVSLIHIIASGTIDEAVFRSLANKADAVEAVIEVVRKARSGK